MRVYLTTAVLTLFVLGFGSGFNFTESQWGQTCHTDSRVKKWAESLDHLSHHQPEVALQKLQELEGCATPEIEEESAKAQASLALANFRQTRHYATRALNLNPRHAQAFELRAQAYFDERRFTLALDDLEAAKKVAPLSLAAEKVHSEILDTLGLTRTEPRKPASEKTPSHSDPF